MDSTTSTIKSLIDKLNTETTGSTSGTETLTLPGFESSSYDSYAGLTVGSLNIADSDTITLTNGSGMFTSGVGGASGSFTIGNGGTGAIGGGSYIYTTDHTWAHNPSTINQNGRMTLQGERADIEINGVSVMATLKAIQERLNLLTPNKELEAEWEELRVLGEQYRALEKKCKEKIDIWNKLKQMPPPEV